jgi:hypothetical protein
MGRALPETNGGFHLKTKLHFLILLMLCGVLPAQEFRATISGHVLDSTGAAVPNAKIQAVNIDTNETTTAASDPSGAYSIPFLRPGNYKLTATATGFKQFVRDRVTLEVGKVAGIDITLEVGAVTESVEVTAEAALLETQTASRGGVVNTQQVSELPLNARNPFMLGAMMSGVTFNGAAIWQRPFDNGAIAQWSVNGGRDSSSEYMLDGASNNGQMGSNNVAYVPIVDAVQEFNVMANTYNAEYGHSGGGIMNVVLKSGTNTFHVTGWEYLRRTPLDANTFQNNAQGKPRPEHYLDQYGFQLEGPVVIPKILPKDGKVRLFYLGSFENYREGTPNPLIVSWPEPEMRSGDFSKLVNNAGQPITIYNPFDYTIGPNGDPIRNPFPGNKIPLSMINPVAAAVTKYMPLPNQPSPGGFRYSTNNLSIPSYFDADKFYNLILKFDWNFGDRNRAFFRHASNDRTEDRAVNGIDNKPGTDGQQPFQRINDAYVVDWVGTVSPTFILNARASYNRFIEKGYGAANAGFDVTSFGLPASLIKTLPSPIYFGRWNFYSGNSGSSSVYNSLGRGQSNNYTNTYQLAASATKIWNQHTLKGGIDIRQINYLIQNTGDILRFDSYAGPTSRNWSTPDATSGDPFATFLLGIPNGNSNYPLFPWWKQWYVAPYFQDDWKVSRRLTLNLGLRWDFNFPVHEKWNRMNGPFDPNAPSALASQIDLAPIASQIPADLAPLYANLKNLKGSLTFAGVNGVPSTPANLRKTNWQPRIGVAYQISDRLVLRTGFGRYYGNFNNDFFQTAGFATSTDIVNSNDGGRTFIPNVLSNPYPNGILTPTGASAGSLTFVGKNNPWFDPNYKIPNSWQFSFGFQYQVTKASTLDISYVGSRSFDQTMQKDYNLPPVDLRDKCNGVTGGRGDFCDAPVPNPFKGIPAFIGTSFYTANTISRWQMSRPFPQFNGTLIQYGRNDSEIHYNSLQVNYNFRFRGGLNLLGNYTLSKQVEVWGFNDPYRSVYQSGLYLLDRPHVIKLTAIYELPFGQGKRWGAGANGFVKKLISGWEITNFFVDPLKGFPSDLPGSVMILRDPATTPGGGYTGKVDWKANQVREWNPCVLQQRADGSIVPTANSIALGCGSGPDFSNYAWLWTYAGSGQSNGPGYAPRYTPLRSGQIRRHHAFQMDASLLKTTNITERLRTQFGVEAFNLLNHNYFGRDQVNQDPNSAAFGSVFPAQVSTQNILPRQIQIRMKIMW